MKNIAISLDSGTPYQRNLATNFFAKKGWAYWHWIDDFWIVQVPDTYEAKALWMELESLPGFGTPSILVFEILGPIKYWGRAKNEAWDWLRNIGSPSA